MWMYVLGMVIGILIGFLLGRDSTIRDEREQLKRFVLDMTKKLDVDEKFFMVVGRSDDEKTDDLGEALTGSQNWRDQ